MSQDLIELRNTNYYQIVNKASKKVINVNEKSKNFEK